MNYPASEYQKPLMRIVPKTSPPECVYRGSTLLTTTLSNVEGSGVQSQNRLDSRYKHSGMTDF